ncbi:MAG: hypothetical protein HY922_02125, partial [Elusimicrobia bacterium]|nr:hypothetical protein [Elusimicrobiota bacterium]
AHNDLLQVLSTTGLAGGLAYLWLLAALALEAARVMRVPGRQDEAAAISGGLLAFFLNMKLNPVSVELMAVAAVLAGALLDQALALAPDFGPLPQLRLEAAGLRGDRSKAAEIQGRLERLRALRPGWEAALGRRCAP